MSGPDMEGPRGPGGHARPDSNGTAGSDALGDSTVAPATENEEAVLGSMLQTGQDGVEAIAAVSNRLDPSVFTSADRRELFVTLVDMHLRGVPNDLPLVTEELRRRDALALVGPDQLYRLAECVPSAASVLYHAEVLLDRAARRRIIKAADCVKTQAASLAVPLDEIRGELSHLVELGRGRAGGVPAIPDYRPFPIDALPEPLRSFVVSSAQAIGCDDAMVALPLLSALAAAIGNARRIRLKATWTEPSIVWTALVAPSGAVKSPPFDAALAPLRATQDLALKDYLQAMEGHATELLRHQAALTDWKRAKQRAPDPPAAPKEPRARRIIVADATTEALAPILRDNWRGLLLARDELSGWLRGFDAYRNGRGGDVAHWLEWFRGAPSTIDRKTGSERIIHVPCASVSVTGTVQPDVLRAALGSEHFADGLAARLLVAMPPQKPRVWSKAVVASDLTLSVKGVFGRLLALLPADEQPVLVDLSSTGERAWIDWYDRHGREQAGLTGDLAAASSKLEGYAARLALVLHLVREAATDATEVSSVSSTVDANDIAAAVQLVEWFGREAERVYAVLGETGRESEDRQLVELIVCRRGSITARDLQKSSRRYRTADDADLALQRLVDAGRGYWDDVPTGPHGGRPTRILRLRAADDGVDTTDTTSSERRDGVDSSVPSVSPAPSVAAAEDELVFGPNGAPGDRP